MCPSSFNSKGENKTGKEWGPKSHNYLIAHQSVTWVKLAWRSPRTSQWSHELKFSVVMWFLIDFALNKNGFWPERLHDQLTRQPGDDPGLFARTVHQSGQEFWWPCHCLQSRRNDHRQILRNALVCRSCWRWLCRLPSGLIHSRLHRKVLNLKRKKTSVKCDWFILPLSMRNGYNLMKDR